MKTSDLFKQELANVPKDVGMQVDWSFAISNKIYELLQERNMSQKDLATIMGKRECEVSKWMCGTHNFTISTIAKISSALGAPIISV